MSWSFNIPFKVEHGKTTPTARDYVQDGLVAMWHGIENSEWGVHDGSIKNWVDLIGGVKLTPWSVAESDFGWSDNTPWFKAFMRIYKDYGLTDSGTIEFCGNPASIFGNSVGDKFFAIAYTGTQYYSCSLLSQKTPASGSWKVDAQANSAIREILSNQKTTLSARIEGGFSHITWNGGREVTSSAESFSGGNLVYIGNGLGTVISTDAHSVRIYNRSLTDAEIAHNYEIDKAIFNLS